MSVTVDSYTRIKQSVEENKETFFAVSKAIHANPEIGNKD